MDEYVCLEGPVEFVDGKLVLRIPLEAGGKHLVRCAKGISQIKGENLEIEIKNWLAEKLMISAGSFITVDNKNGKFNIYLDDKKVTSLKGPVESKNGQLFLRIPLEYGGKEFIECTKGFAEVIDNFLNIKIDESLARKLNIREGSQVKISNIDHEFHLDRDEGSEG